MLVRPAPSSGGVDRRAAWGLAVSPRRHSVASREVAPGVRSSAYLCVARRRSWTACSSEVENQKARRYSPLLEKELLAKDSAFVSSEWKAVPDIWRSTAEKYGDKVALVDPYHDPPSQMTYKQIEQEILIFSEGLRVLGIVPAEKIALFADNSCRWLIADQGIMAMGAINVARGTRSSNEELVKIYYHSESVALVADNPTFLNRVAETLCPRAGIKFVILLWGDKSHLSKLLQDITVLCYDEIIDLGRKGRDALLYSIERGHHVYETIDSDDIATLVYTSGTSSSPKGVMLTHRNLLYQINNLRDIIPAERTDRFLSMLPPWHIYERAAEYFIFTRGVEQVYTTMKKLKDDMQQYRPEYIFSVPLIYEMLYSAIQRQISRSCLARKVAAYFLLNISFLYMDTKRIYEGKVITATKGQPCIFMVILDCLWSRAFAAILWPLHALATNFFYRKFHSVIGISKAGITAGGSLPMHIDRFFEAIGVKLQNGYGLTETSPAVAMRRPDYNVIGTVGQPMKQTAIKVVDSETGRAVPDGSKGIIKVRGPQVMKGYYKDPPATNEVLDEEGWFSTGDIGWIIPDNIAGRSRHCSGMIVLEGRAKDTIVLMTGENVEPSELEEAAMRSRLIKQIVVIGQDQRRLGALIVPNKEELVLAAGGIPNAEPISYVLSKEQVMRMIRKDVTTWTSGCSFQIGPILILDEAFTVENGLMTPTMKVRRDRVLARYRDPIAQLYKQDI